MIISVFSLIIGVLGLCDIAYAGTSTSSYQSAVEKYKQGAITDAVTLFTTSSSSKDKEIRKKSMYMLGSIYAAQENWTMAIDSFSTIVTEYPNDSYADDAQYWIAKIEVLKDDSSNTVPYFKRVYQQYPNGDMAPNAYYMAIRESRECSEKQQIFIELVNKYPNHTMIDDAARWIWYDECRQTVADSLVQSPPSVSDPVSQCRLHYVIGYLHSASPKKQEYFEKAAKCTMESDIHRDVYLSWVDELNAQKKFTEANRIAEQFKKLYVQPSSYDKNYQVYVKSLHNIAIYSNYSDDSDEAVLFYNTVCSPTGLPYAQASYASCQEYKNKTGKDPLTSDYDYTQCFDDFLRSYGCLYYTKKLSVGDLVTQSQYAHASSSDMLSLLELSAKKANKSEFAVLVAKINRSDLSSWEQERYDELLQQMK